MTTKLHVNSVVLNADHAVVQGGLEGSGLPSYAVQMPVTRAEALEFEPGCDYSVTFELIEQPKS